VNMSLRLHFCLAQRAKASAAEAADL